MSADWSAVATDAERVAAQREEAHLRRQLAASPAGVALRKQRPSDTDDAIADALLGRLNAYAETQVRRRWRQQAVGSWVIAALVAIYGVAYFQPVVIAIHIAVAALLAWCGVVFWRARGDADDSEVASFRSALVARVTRGEWPVPDNLNKRPPLEDWQKLLLGVIAFTGVVMAALPIIVMFSQ